jgi:hypothetical protein
MAGVVAPVNKTVTYNTVKNIPGEPDKCWITQNLGSDRQALAKDDNTEESAGWYWQFNRRQGYKHTGSEQTPLYSWLTSIVENSVWLPEHDPCANELGSTWRLPSRTEWNNVITSGLWTNWNGPWNSPLRIHAAGFIYSGLTNRGIRGRYWSNFQSNSYLGRDFTSEPNRVSIGYGNKIVAHSVRCVRSSICPYEAVHETAQNQVTWNWHPVSGATGYKWSNTNDYTTAEDLGSDTSRVETGLNCPQIYKRYIWAYNGTAHSDPVTIFGTPCFHEFTVCGDSMTVRHKLNGVVPEEKLVHYGTVSGILGETTKCWITSNLGADHQAASQDDATEESAGWYWQFNRKQGYKHDGSMRIPNDFWYTGFDENSDWQSANDPCSIELGSTWRIPTFTEWNNVVTANGWDNYNDAYSSPLKLHTSGYLSNTNGWVIERGSAGNYWSTSQLDDDEGKYLSFNVSFCNTIVGSKATGLTLRCLNGCAPDSPAEGIHIPSTNQIIWKWHSVTDATGYKWNTINHYSSAENIGNDTIKIETGLSCGTSYIRYVWAYNNYGYSSQTALTQSTMICAPILNTVSIANIGDTAATSGGQLLDEGGLTINAKGVCWSTSPAPSLINDHTIDEIDSNNFESLLTDLSPGTLYYVRAYATNSVGTSYGDELSFTT